MNKSVPLSGEIHKLFVAILRVCLFRVRLLTSSGWCPGQMHRINHVTIMFPRTEWIARRNLVEIHKFHLRLQPKSAACAATASAIQCHISFRLSLSSNCFFLFRFSINFFLLSFRIVVVRKFIVKATVTARQLAQLKCLRTWVVFLFVSTIVFYVIIRNEDLHNIYYCV